MRSLPAVVIAVAMIALPATAQDIPDAPIAPGGQAIPTPEMAAPAAAVAPPPGQAAPVAAAPAFREYDKVEVADAENPGMWKACTVLTVFKGAYEVSCNYTRTIARDVSTRKPGGQATPQTAAQPVSGPPFKAGDIVLGSIMGLPDDWRLCVILRNEVASSNSYPSNCGGSQYRLLPKWVRVDPDAPQ
ncbi:hypothetical protein [Sphingomonas sp.]|uniref:hypothetical protein n=1 Tax=Sphingomonas sp. TaxID=28214 RepID=UPI001EC2F351|nr:hypothetical protein [Sphingomonas sp.]MBX3593812.1 hypothetical protein [Sphingomonas sp.]